MLLAWWDGYHHDTPNPLADRRSSWPSRRRLDDVHRPGLARPHRLAAAAGGTAPGGVRRHRRGQQRRSTHRI
ncbi:hypothetical protein QJS66_15640 [Kocuria rhizophila]|nr:hypothetical protein QJS66_15640 [Kocuria rhizophila]